jgi:hypothetical protein
MVAMNKRTVSLLIVFLVFSAGCVTKSKPPPPPPVYITPCNVLGDDILLEAVGENLEASIVKPSLMKAFVDDLTNERSGNVASSYSLDCWWGRNVGEKSDLYYCGGAYTSPELSSENVIKRYVRKEFKVGFNVEKKPGSSWTVDGNTYNEPTKFYLTVKSVESTCTLAS